jgi:ATP-dependent DNA helicase MPH1
LRQFIISFLSQNFTSIPFQAHKAKGKFAYCEVIKEINAVHNKFRVVALSATPGKTADVIEIIQNLLIAKIEVRTEKSPDVRAYTFTKE